MALSLYRDGFCPAFTDMKDASEDNYGIRNVNVEHFEKYLYMINELKDE